MGILAAALLYLYSLAIPEGGTIQIFAVSGLWLFLIVVALYAIIVLVVGLLLTTMRQDSWWANLAKSMVSTALIIALMDWFLIPVLWIFGYTLQGDIRNTLLIASIARTLLKIFLGRRWGDSV